MQDMEVNIVGATLMFVFEQKLAILIKKLQKEAKTDDASFDAKWERDRITSESKWSNIKQVEFKSPVGRQGTDDMILEVLPTWRNLDEKKEYHL